MTPTSRSRAPVVGDFPLLVLRKRGPCNMVSIIRMAKNNDDFLKLLNHHFSKRAITRISRRTKGLSKNSYWFLYRRCLITGTLAKRVINQNQRNSSNPKLNRSITRSFPGNYMNAAMQYGIDNEQNALDSFFQVFKRAHTNPKLHDIGVVLHQEIPFIAGSPDGDL